MNHMWLRGRIVIGPSFHTDDDTGVEVALLTLCCGTADQVIRVVATKKAVSDLRQFQNGDSISVEGRLMWREGTLDILAESIRQWTSSVYRKTAPQDKFPRQVKGMRGVPIG